MENKTINQISETIAKGIRSAIAEAEALRVQIALGKLEARDFFENLKHEVRAEFQEAAQNLEKLKTQPGIQEVLNELEHLRVQIALGKAETLEEFERQKHQLRDRLHQLDNALLNNPEWKEDLGHLKLSIEKFRLKLELIALKFRLGKVSSEYSAADLQKEMEERIESMKNKWSVTEKQIEAGWEHFSKELGLAFDHLRKAFTTNK